MKSQQKKAVFGGIFSHFLLRNVAIQLLSAILIISCMLPFFSQWLTDTQRNQWQSLAQAIITTTKSALESGNLRTVATLSHDFLLQQSDIRYILFSFPDRQDIAISRNQVVQQYQPWSEGTPPKTTTANNLHASEYVPDGLILAPSEQWLLTLPVKLPEQAGHITVAFYNQSFITLMNDAYSRFGFVLLASIMLGLMLFLWSSRKIRQQIVTFSHTARQLARGELTARAPENAIGELSLLAKSTNKMAANLEVQSNRLKSMGQMVAQTNDAFILFDQVFNLVFANPALQKLTGYTAKEFKKTNLTHFANVLQIDMTHLKRALVMMQVNMATNFNQDISLLRKDGHSIHIHCRLEQIVDDDTGTEQYLLVLSDISERKALEQELHSLAYYDKLTGLPNRRMFIDYLHKRIKQLDRKPSAFALFFMDLDDFKNINDSMGHEAGDILLIQVAKRLSEIFRGSDLVTRLGGDEFIVMIEDIDTPDHVELAKLADKAIQMLSTHPIVLNGRALTIGTSLGIATFPDNGVDADTLIKNADTAMYAAKQSGKNNYAFYNEDMNVALREYLEIETDLKAAIQSDDQLQLHYQPIVNLHTKKMAGVEVLARWNHPTKGQIPPDQFIGVAEKTDLILALSELLLNQAFKQAKRWQARGLTHYISVNISVRQFEKPNFINMLTSLVLDYEVDPKKLQLEFTEGVMLENSEMTIEKFNEIKSLGFRIAIDDFGTGYSSLSYIHKLPIDVIKIDQAFVADILNNEKSQAILSAITQLSNRLNIETVAEGIEFNAHEALLLKCLCQYGQGYLYDASMLLDQLEDKYLPLFPESLVSATNLAEA